MINLKLFVFSFSTQTVRHCYVRIVLHCKPCFGISVGTPIDEFGGQFDAVTSKSLDNVGHV